MSDVTYRFLPWVREGLAAQIRTTDTLGAGVRGRARLDVDATVTRRAGAAIDVTRGIVVSGPGDVIGIDRRQVIRTDPKPNSTDFEPNFLVQIEFDRPDFPWLFTPAAANNQDRLRPWLVLIVVAAGDGVTVQPEAGSKLPVLTIEGAARPSRQLPNLAESWAWAHSQVVIADTEQLEDVLAGRPEQTASRLICPRRLDPNTSYHACVVPAFEAGRRAGLGLAPAAADETSLRPAWTVAGDAPVKLPAYYSWRFATGAGGDFESLAEALRARPIPPEVGRHELYVGAAGPPLPALPPEAPGAVVALRGALVPPEQPAPPWPPATRAQVQDGLRQVLDTPAQRLGAGGAAPAGQAVTPPLYGRWLAAQATVPKTAGPRWMRTLNLDPRHRAVSGLATRVVQGEQERLMEQAWAQVGEIEKANRELRWAQVALEVRRVLLGKHAMPLSPGVLLQLTQTAHRRMLVGPTTLWSTARASALPEASLTAPFQRAVRPRGRWPAAPIRRVTALSARSSRVSTAGGCRPRRPIVRPTGFRLRRDQPARPGVAPEVLTRIRTAASDAATRPPRVVTADQVRRVTTTDATVRTITETLQRVTRTTTAPAAPAPRGTPIVLPFPLPPKLTTKQLALARTVTARFQETTAVTIEHIARVAVQPSPADASAARRRDAPCTGARPARPPCDDPVRVDARITIPDRCGPSAEASPR